MRETFFDLVLLPLDVALILCLDFYLLDDLGAAAEAVATTGSGAPASVVTEVVPPQPAPITPATSAPRRRPRAFISRGK